MADFPFFKELLSNIAIRHVTNAAVNRSITGNRQAFGYVGGYWELMATMARCDYDKAKQIASFINSLEGRSGTFNIVLPQRITRNSYYSGSIFVKGASQTGKAILVDGLAVSQTILKNGDFIKFENSAKVYQLSSDLVSDSGGEGTLNLHMAIVGNLPADNEIVIHRPSEVSWTVALVENSYDWDIDYFCRSGWEIGFEEVW
jgi:hypothetical protein